MNRSLFRTFLTIFIMLALLVSLPLIYICGKSVSGAIENVQKEFDKQQYDLSEAITTTIEESFTGMRDTAIFLQNESWLSQFCKQGISESEFDVIGRIRLSARLSKLFGSSQIARELSVAVPKQNSIISMFGWYTPMEYAFTYYTYHADEYSGTHEFRMPGPCNDPDCPNPSCRYLVQIPVGSTALTQPYQIIYTLDKRLLSDYVVRATRGTGLKLRMEINGTVLYDADPVMKVDRVVSTLPSGVTYSFSFPEINDGLRANAVWSSILTYVVAWLILMLIIGICSLGLAMPIERILHKLSHDRQSAANPLRMLENGVDLMKEQNLRMGAELNRYRQIVSNEDLLLNLLISNDPEKYVKDIIDFWPWFNQGMYCAMILLDHSDREYATDDFAHLASLIDSSMCVEYRIMNIIGSDMALLLCFGSNQSEFDAGIYDEKYRESLLKLESVSQDLIIGSGPIHRGVIGIQTSYQLARKLCLQSTYAKGLAKPESGYFYPISMELQLLNNLRLGKKDTCREILDVIFRENSESESDSGCCERMLSIMLDTLLRYAQENDLTSEDYTHAFTEAFARRNWELCRQTLLDFCTALCEYGQHSRKTSTDSRNREIYDYVVTHMTDSSLSLQQLSDHFSIPVSTLSKLFKDIAGVNFYDFLSGIRVQAAIQHICDGRKTITEIASNVGYESYASFKRAFVKHTGVNPSEYKTLHQEEPR